MKGTAAAAADEDEAKLERLVRIPSARAVARLMTTAWERLFKTEVVMVASIKAAPPALV